MTKNRWMKRKTVLAGLSLTLFLATLSDHMAFQVSAEETDDQVIEIANADDLLALAENCRYDSYSVGKTVKLTADVDLTDQDFDGIPYFSGTFDGDSHTISGVDIDYQGSDFGFFRYVGQNAFVSNLNIDAQINASGSQKNIGGVAGVNSGTITNCTFSGILGGDTAVGAIAGWNKQGANIVNCTSDADITATNQTGGIAGKNEGLVDGCTSKSLVNTQELDTTLDIGGVDLGSLNLTQNVVDRNDMGGIAGNSNGVISNSVNYGTIGYNHTGYNVGGIVGSQSGKVLGCTNEGTVYGRKDVGGIVGQAEPYIESEYLKDRTDQVKNSVNDISNTLNQLSDSVSNASADASAYAESISNQYKKAADELSNAIGDLSDSMQDVDPQTEDYFNNIDDALNKMNDIEGEDKDKIISQDQKDALQEQWQVVTDNLTNIEDSMSSYSDNAEDFANSISGQLNQQNVTNDIQGMAATVDREMQTISDSINSISNQINNISNTVNDTVGMVTDEGDHIEDVSTAENAENTDGVISGSVNRGTIQGDLNVGGIAGTMNIEYDVDPEYDLDLSGSTNVRLRSTVNDVVIHSVNYGEIISKKNCAGGITGLQELGLIYGSEGYGRVHSDTGDYAGGIVGNSASAVSGSYSLCNVESENYTGGICGQGYTMRNSIAIATISGDGEAKGSLAGTMESDGEVKNNFYVGDELSGIDNIDYSGVADRVSYDDVMAMEGIPEGFHQITITFKADDAVIDTTTVAYNANLNSGDLPEIPEKEGYYATWPDDLTQTPLTQNQTVEAEYHLWTESIAGSENAENGKPLFLVEGKFYDDNKIAMDSCDTEGLHGDIAYAYAWHLEGTDVSEKEKVTGHFYITTASGSNEVWYRDKESGEWNRADSKTEGSYLTAEIPYEADFAVVHHAVKQNNYYLYGAIAAVLILLVLVVRKRRKKKGISQK